MADLAWHDFYKIGIGFIDDDHREMLAIMRRISAALGVRKTAECRAVLEQLLALATSHFSREEQFLALTGYPGFEDHCRYHGRLMGRARDMLALCERARGTHEIDACFDSMSRLFIDDVLRGDVHFKSYMEYEGYIRREL